ncbi:MAG: tetratricopeptide repeat protein [Brevinema sp.]
MKYFYYLVLVLFSVQTSFYTLSTEEVEEIYAQAIDLRYQGDYSRSRFLLESLYLQGVTNEYILSVLTEVYFEYLKDLSLKKQEAIIRTAYPGIRQNIAKIWDLYPLSEQIQNNSIKIAWGIGDFNFGFAMAMSVLEKNSYHLLANYFAGLYFIQQSNTTYAYPYFKKVAKQDPSKGNEEFIFQSREYVADIDFDRTNFSEAVAYYESALEVASGIGIVVKVAMATARDGDFEKSDSYFQNIPLSALTPELFDAYMGVLYMLNTPKSIFKMNALLSKNIQNLPPFSKAIAFSRLGQTQKALSVLENDTFLVTELPQAHHTFKITLLDRFHQYCQKATSLMSIADDFVGQKKYDQALEYLRKVNADKQYLIPDQELNLALLSGETAFGMRKYQDAIGYYKDALGNIENPLALYAQLFDLYMITKNFDQAERLLPYFSTNKDIFSAYLYFAQKNYAKAAELMEKILPNISLNLALNNMVAAIYTELDRFDEAEQLLLMIYQKHSADPETLNHLAYLYARQKKKLDQALSFAKEAVDQEDNIAYLDTLAWVYMQRNEVDQAGDIFKIIENKLQNHVYSQDQLVEIYEHLDLYYQTIGKSGKKF